MIQEEENESSESSEINNDSSDDEGEIKKSNVGYEKGKEEEEEDPEKPIPEAVKSMLFIGDSITAGTVSSDYIAVLQKIIGPKISLQNEGSNGDCTYHVKDRLLATTFFTGSYKLLDPKEPLPSVIILQIGTNDILCQQNPNFRNIATMRSQSLDSNSIWSVNTFITCYTEIIQICLQRSPNSHIAILSIPPIGENLLSQLNNTVLEYNRALKLLCESFGDDKKVCYLELNEQLGRMLATYYASTSIAPPVLDLDMWNMIWTMDKATLSKYVFQKTWSQITRENKLLLFHDHVHFNEIAAGICAHLIRDYLRTLN
jgi:lysophospholipase L1-like esterase